MQNYLIIYNGTAGKSDNETIAKKAQQVLHQAGKMLILQQPALKKMPLNRLKHQPVVMIVW
ncbi:hypothetical protein [Lentilactobacillus hilgardii]|uniref:hypothetical protein n=1 Tax=Lentilactobacillus hilgardii TaxID=1588 RepID=UPI0021C25648|nr:hypothetical protein [Lentilactobacillus hilgardii]